MNEKGAKLAEYLKAFELAKLGREVQEQEEKDIMNSILAEHCFYSSINVRNRIKEGDRITDESDLFALSDDDKNKFWEIANPIYFAKGVSDEKGHYKVLWYSIINKARRELINFYIDEVLPASMRQGFELCRTSIVYQDKLIDIIKSSFKA